MDILITTRNKMYDCRVNLYMRILRISEYDKGTGDNVLEECSSFFSIKVTEANLSDSKEALVKMIKYIDHLAVIESIAYDDFLLQNGLDANSFMEVESINISLNLATTGKRCIHVLRNKDKYFGLFDNDVEKLDISDEFFDSVPGASSVSEYAENLNISVEMKVSEIFRFAFGRGVTPADIEDVGFDEVDPLHMEVSVQKNCKE